MSPTASIITSITGVYVLGVSFGVVLALIIWLRTGVERKYWRRQLDQERERHRLHVAAIEADHARQARGRVTTRFYKKPPVVTRAELNALNRTVHDAYADTLIIMPIIIDDEHDQVPTDRITKAIP